MAAVASNGMKTLPDPHGKTIRYFRLSNGLRRLIIGLAAVPQPVAQLLDREHLDEADPVPLVTPPADHPGERSEAVHGDDDIAVDRQVLIAIEADSALADVADPAPHNLI